MSMKVATPARPDEDAKALLDEMEALGPTEMTYDQGVYVALRWLLSLPDLPFDKGMEDAVNWMRDSDAPRPEVGSRKKGSLG